MEAMICGAQSAHGNVGLYGSQLVRRNCLVDHREVERPRRHRVHRHAPPASSRANTLVRVPTPPLAAA